MSLRRRGCCPSPWVKKPLWALDSVVANPELNVEMTVMKIPQLESPAVEVPGRNGQDELKRHLGLFGLVSIGVGGTIGSGIMVLCGLIAREYAGPATILSWALAGVAAFLSGCCYAELSGKIPVAGSSYAYAFATMGELPAFITAACLTLEYLFSAAAVARSWGDKVVEWLQIQLGAGEWVQRFLTPGYDFNPCALLVSTICTSLLMCGVTTSKVVTDVFTWLKVCLVLAMAVGGLFLMKAENLQPFMPFGVTGVMRGATSSFFGYIGYDGVCCVASEAINPHVNLPKAVLVTLVLVTVLYMIAALSLTGMVPYYEISRKSGFPDAFEYRGVHWASQLTAAGEIITLPIVVFITLMLQTRLQYAVAKDGLLPEIFHEIQRGSPTKGTIIAGCIMTFISSFIPFTYLNDFVSAGILVVFSVTNSSLIILRQESIRERTFDCEKMLLLFNLLSLTSNLVLKHSHDSVLWRLAFFLLLCGTLSIGLRVWWLCRSQSVSSGIPLNKLEKKYFSVPAVPFLPLFGIFVNYFLLAQLEFYGIALLLTYLCLSVIFYFLFGFFRSIRDHGGWRESMEHGDYSPVLT